MSPLGEPLEGTTVVAFEQAVAMPYCTFVLAEMGAKVIKIERPGTGDVIRSWDDSVRGLSSGYVWLNANKQTLALDVGSPDGLSIVKSLIAGADIFVENFAPGVTERLGIGYQSLQAINERLIYCSLSGYGQTGPYRNTKAYDLLVQGESGILLTSGHPEAPAKVGVPITDLIAGTDAALGVLAALHQRTQSGVGAYIDVSMLESATSWLGYFPQRLWHLGEEPPRTGTRHQYICPYGCYEAKDGELVNLVVASEEHWERFAREVVERPDWLDNPRFSSVKARHEHREVLDPAVEDVIVTRESAYWVERLGRAGLPHGRVRTIREVVEHPQLNYRGAFVEATSPAGEIPLVKFPLADSTKRRHIPSLGEHSSVILKEIGISEQEIERLRASGVIG